MHLVRQIKREFRSDGLPFPMQGNATLVNACFNQFGNYDSRTTLVANTQCQSVPAFGSLVSHAWVHELNHTVEALDEAELPDSDVHFLWEKLAATTSFELDNQTLDEKIRAHQNISSASAATHTGSFVAYSFWRFVGSGWAWATTFVDSSGSGQ